MPDEKKRWQREVVIFDIATGKRSKWPSVVKAAAKVGVCASYFGKVLRSGMAVNGYIVAYIEDEEEARIKLRNYKSRGAFTKEKKEPAKGLVSLRIDSKTVIMVPPEKATPEYAEKWKARHDTDNRRKN